MIPSGINLSRMPRRCTCALYYSIDLFIDQVMFVKKIVNKWRSRSDKVLVPQLLLDFMYRAANWRLLFSLAFCRCFMKKHTHTYTQKDLRIHAQKIHILPRLCFAVSKINYYHLVHYAKSMKARHTVQNRCHSENTSAKLSCLSLPIYILYAVPTVGIDKLKLSSHDAKKLMENLKVFIIHWEVCCALGTHNLAAIPKLLYYLI